MEYRRYLANDDRDIQLTTGRSGFRPPPIERVGTATGGEVIEHAERGSLDDHRVPIWRRITAFWSLGALVAVIGLLLAAVIAAGALLLLFVLDRAIAG